MAILKAAPEGAKVFDLEAARAARAEARSAAGGGNPLLKVSGGFIEVHPEIELSAVDDLNANRFEVALGKILVDPADVPTLLGSGLTSNDLTAIAYFITGATLGE
jgi:hypothetical protein